MGRPRYYCSRRCALAANNAGQRAIVAARRAALEQPQRQAVLIETQIQQHLVRIRAQGLYQIDPWQQKPGTSTITQGVILAPSEDV